MASIFTYESETPRVSSPWNDDSNVAPSSQVSQDTPHSRFPNSATAHDMPPIDAQPLETEITRLQPEPQEGPVEYKLHLLLRPRRRFQSTSTSSRISGSRHTKFSNRQPGRSLFQTVFDTVAQSGTDTPPSSSTQQTRQHRLEQLTTQLLWRLQQSSPHHTSSASNIILPSLPEALPELRAPQQPAKLAHGLEESQGALYEIGVADDGNLIGLADDEIEESLNNLRAMAACLGCGVEVLRKEAVGRCEWTADVMVGGKARKVQRVGKLSVAEALVKPYLQANSSPAQPQDAALHAAISTKRPTAETEQLRITLTGPTMSGKSSLLGTLTTSTLDNGRGTSRLSMLKHRHEINSGVTSSVSQELLGYHDTFDGNVDVVNYASDNIASWIDMHIAANDSRLVLIADSAGHPRYRRTTVRGLVGCAPHWTLMCFPADDTEDTTRKTGSTATLQNSGPTMTDVDLSAVQLGLCLKLRLPLVIVITKLDLASRSGLKASLTKVLDALKTAGRKPAILPSSTGEVDEGTLQVIQAALIETAYSNVLPLLNDTTEVVPIILTSAVQGTGIGNVHALLHELPIPSSIATTPQSRTAVFHVEDTFRKPAEVDGIILSGILRHGQVSVGETGVLGPFSINDVDDSEDSEDRPSRRASSHLPTSRSFPGALRDAHVRPSHFQLPNQEWRRCKVVSIRNLRLPVHALLSDQAGTLAVVPDDATKKAFTSAPFGRIRKGMVFTTMQPPATRSFVAKFARDDLESLAVGNHVVVYIASVRASAKVIGARVPDPPTESLDNAWLGPSTEETFGFDDLKLDSGPSRQEPVAGAVTSPSLLVTFSFDASREFVILGDQVLVMPGGGPNLYGGHERGEKGVAGLDGFVGDITEIFG